jgi:hypothetical protein
MLCSGERSWTEANGLMFSGRRRGYPHSVVDYLRINEKHFGLIEDLRAAGIPPHTTRAGL